MTAVPVAPGDLSIDFSGATLGMPEAYTAGARAIHRYSAGAGNAQPNVQWKLCGPDEIAHAVAAGEDFIANSEWYESRVEEGGGAGQLDGLADLHFWQSRGLAKAATIYVSWDKNPSRLKYAAVGRYLAAYGKALAGYYKVGAYAGTPFLKYALSKKLISYGWRPNAASWSNDSLPYQPDTSTPELRHALMLRARVHTPAAIYQTGNYWFNKGADENLILWGCGSHLQALHPPVVAPTKAPVPAHGPYPDGVGNARSLVSPDQHVLFVPHDDGIEVRKDHVRVGFIHYTKA